MCLTTHATRSSYVIYFEHKTKFYERQVTQIFFVFMPFCDISELYASSSIYFQAPFDCAEGPLSRQCRATRTASGIWQAWIATDCFKTNVTYLHYISGIFVNSFTKRGAIHFSFLAGTLRIVLGSLFVNYVTQLSETTNLKSFNNLG